MSRIGTILVGLGASLAVALVLLPSLLEIDRRPMALVSDSTGTGDIAQLGSAIDPATPVPAGWDTFTSTELPNVGDLQCVGEPAESCLVHRAAGPHVLLVGDSHAIRIAPAFAALAEDHGFTLSISAVASCRWQVGLAPEDFRMEDCYGMRDDLYGRLLSDLDPDIVVTVSAGFEPVGVRDPELDGLPLPEVLRRTTNESITLFLRHASELLLLEPLPMPGFDVPTCLSASETVGECAFSYSDVPEVDSTPVSTYATIYRNEALIESRVTSRPYDSLICAGGSPCTPVEDGLATMSDTHHVNTVQAFEHRDRLWQALEPVVAKIDPESAGDTN